MAVPLLLMIGGNVVRAVAPKVIQQLMRQGAKKATTQAVKKAGGTSKVPTVTSVKQAKNLAPKIRTAAGMKPFKPISGAGSRMPGRKIGEGAVQAAPKLSKPTTGAGRATLKKQPPSLKKTPPSMKKAPPSLKKTPKVIKTPSAVPKQSGPKVMQFGVNAPKITRSKIRPASPARPTTKPKLSNVDKGLLAATGIAATQIGKKKEGPASAMAVPMPRPKRLKDKEGGPGRPFPKKNIVAKTPKLKSTSFDKGGNTGFGVKGNSFVGGPAERAVMMKYYGGTGSQAAKAALAGTQGQLKKLGMDALRKERQAAKIKDMKAREASGMTNKTKGGKIGKKPITRTVNKYSTTKYDTPQKDAQYTGEKKITIGGKLKPGMTSKRKKIDGFIKKSRQYKPTGKGKGKIPSSYLGFSKLPERVQQKMDPDLAAKYVKGGSIKDGCARQVKGFGAARRPKK